jgi:Ca2+-binding RTX toxin-like protein
MRRRIGIAFLAALACVAGSGAAIAINDHGGKGSDRLVGTSGADKLKGLAGRDTLIGGKGRDTLIGGKGRDVLRGGPDRDSFNMRSGVQLAAPGRDKIDARDGGQDEINCGAGGNDLAIVDAAEDGVYDCEKVREP